ncbi:glutathione S-transferase family protein [Sphingomonas sinipercae]|uniref:Glutathione S-transferase family protein n=1 Tax=Sphingomonas sinipercae TaxID=2714944 RepID=A0A6G7ZMI0_9SPHN|nr:glutathione S-transferase family protein [Sphingomonas sinipercae]QIL02135.1 glutathione S-transferase family protein [Sphingomonas sinipercae]
MIIYGSSLSPFVRKVVAFATEKGVAAEMKPIGLGDPDPEFRKASPSGKMPAMVDGDFMLADSSAIVHYIEAKHPEPALIPADPKLRGQCIWFEEFADTILNGCGAKMFFNRVVAPVFLKREGDLAAAAAAERDELPKILDYLERSVPEGEGFLLGDQITLADLAVASPFANLRHMQVAIDTSRYPRTLAYTDRILARESFAPAIAREASALQRLTA